MVDSRLCLFCVGKGPFIESNQSGPSWEAGHAKHTRECQRLAVLKYQTLDKMVEQTGSSPLFAIFVLSLLSLALIPYTIYRFTNQGSAEDVVKPLQVWQ